LLLARGFDPGPADGIVGDKTTSAIRSFQESENLPIDGRISVVLRRALSAGQRGEAVSPEPSLPSPHKQTATSPVIVPVVTVARIETIDGAKIHFSDNTVDPDVDFYIVLDAFSVNNINTADSNERTTLSVRGEINEFSPIEIDGWITPLKDPPELMVNAKIDGLELSPYSPYLHRQMGISFERGHLDTVAAASVADGELDGQFDIDLEQLELREFSDENAQQFADRIGIPVEMAVSLLKDTQGRIHLTIPISGSLASPEMDISNAITSAVGGVLRAAFPPNWVAEVFNV
jgi:peptidoglycan hydrolase-like protein with peptidoglycan-binding domain